jgi:hypothetical protein
MEGHRSRCCGSYDISVTSDWRFDMNRLGGLRSWRCRRRLPKEAPFRKRLVRPRQRTRGPNDALRLKQVIGTKVQCAQSQSKMSRLSARQDRSFGAVELRPMLINVPLSINDWYAPCALRVLPAVEKHRGARRRASGLAPKLRLTGPSC